MKDRIIRISQPVEDLKHALALGEGSFHIGSHKDANDLCYATAKRMEQDDRLLAMDVYELYPKDVGLAHVPSMFRWAPGAVSEASLRALAQGYLGSDTATSPEQLAALFKLLSWATQHVQGTLLVVTQMLSLVETRTLALSSA